jgi:hypothetical protein
MRIFRNRVMCALPQFELQGARTFASPIRQPIRGAAHDNKEYSKPSSRLFSKYSGSTTVLSRGVDGNPGVRVDLPRLTHRPE